MYVLLRDRIVHSIEMYRTPEEEQEIVFEIDIPFGEIDISFIVSDCDGFTVKSLRRKVLLNICNTDDTMTASPAGDCNDLFPPAPSHHPPNR